MDHTPDDILLLIFNAYVHDLKKSPVLLLAIDRRWHALAIETPSLWTRIVFKITTLTIPYFLQGRDSTLDDGIALTDLDVKLDPSTILPYLARSVPHGSNEGLPLEVEIYWKEPPEIQDGFIGCVFPPNLPMDQPCDEQRLHKNFLDQLLLGLVDMTSLYSSDKRGRWVSLTLDLSGFGCFCHSLTYVGTALENLELASLRDMTLIKVLSPNPLFHTPLLEQLTLDEHRARGYPNMTPVRHLILGDLRMLLRWRWEASPLPWSDCLNLEIMTILSHGIPAIPFSLCFPRLHTVHALHPVNTATLESLFDRSQPLKSLTLTQELSTIITLFKKYPKFHVKKFKLKIYSTPVGFEAGSVRPEAIDEAVVLLDICRERIIEIDEGDDELTKLIWKKARSRDD